MELVSLREKNAWIQSKWLLTYGVSFDKYLDVLYAMYDSYQDVEIYADNNYLDIIDKLDIFNIEECKTLIIRGFSSVLSCPIMIRFYNQSRDVDVYVAMDLEEFDEADYEKFNRSLCGYMDSIEIMMHKSV